MDKILPALLVLGALGLLLGGLLAFASRIFAVKTDERLPKLIETLPGANCGACGYTGCAAYAAAILQGASISCCPVGGTEVAKKMGEIMGIAPGEVVRYTANVRCLGTTEAAQQKYLYRGLMDCNAAMRFGGGSKACEYACLGLGSCESVCRFDAIHVRDGIAEVDAAKCTACGMCVAGCPKHLLELKPDTAVYWVGCSSRRKGALTRAVCSNGCIGCKLCEKACEFDAISVVDNLAAIDYNKCTHCGRCAEACPRGIIRGLSDGHKA